MLERPQRQSGGEHVFPFGIGGAFTVDRVCTECDARLGNIADSPLQKQFDVEQRRIALQLRGHRGKVPDPIGDAIRRPLPHPSQAGQRVRVIREDDGATRVESVTHIDYETGFENGRQWIKPTSNTVINPRDSDSVPMLSRSALRKRGIQDESIIETVTHGLIESLETHREDVVVAVPVPIRKGGHQLGLLKIAYELAWLWLGDCWLEDPVARAMRGVLNGDVASGSNIELNDSMDVTEILQLGGLNPTTTHIAFVVSAFGRLLLTIRLFDAHTIGVYVTDDLHSYRLPDENVIVNNSSTRKSYRCAMQQLIGKPLLVFDGSDGMPPASGHRQNKNL